MSKNAFDPTKTPGTFGEIPDHAPRETTQPVTDAALAAQLAQARQNEQVLTPFAPPAGPPNAAAAALEAAARERIAQRREVRPGPAHQPAASETDSPSRGVPTPIADPGKRVTGGFGNLTEAQYNPLNGLELAELVRLLLDELNSQLPNDLRFHIGICYPRARVTLTLRVEGYVQEAAFSDVKQKVHDKTPEDVAAQLATPTTFELSAQRQEFDETETPQDPPDRVRDELGLPKPSKQWVQAGAHRDLVDVVAPPELF